MVSNLNKKQKSYTDSKSTNEKFEKMGLPPPFKNQRTGLRGVFLARKRFRNFVFQEKFSKTKLRYLFQKYLRDPKISPDNDHKLHIPI